MHNMLGLGKCLHNSMLEKMTYQSDPKSNGLRVMNKGGPIHRVSHTLQQHALCELLRAADVEDCERGMQVVQPQAGQFPVMRSSDINHIAAAKETVHGSRLGRNRYDMTPSNKPRYGSHLIIQQRHSSGSQKHQLSTAKPLCYPHPPTGKAMRFTDVRHAPGHHRLRVAQGGLTEGSIA
mmetsp:Transcript_151455/g.263029  ORF Transcript_151455/g.263029 Transcript_151455/m.263029 type:complete len:179 (+) Transcript_151455:981-1517(+)